MAKFMFKPTSIARPGDESPLDFPDPPFHFPVRREKFPVPKRTGNFAQHAEAASRIDPATRRNDPKRSQIRKIPCYFPCSQFFTGRCPTRRGPNIASLELRRRHRGRPFLGAAKPVSQLDPGFPEYPRLSPRTFIGPGARLLEFLFTGPHADAAQQGGNDGTVASAVLRS